MCCDTVRCIMHKPNMRDNACLGSFENIFNGHVIRILVNKIWWQCLVRTSTTRFVSDVGYRMAQKWIWLYEEIILSTMTSNSLTENEEHDSPTHFEDHFWIACLSHFLNPKCVISNTLVGSWFPNSSGQLAGLIVYIIPPEYICIVTRSYSRHTICNNVFRLYNLYLACVCMLFISPNLVVIH